MLGDGEIQEGQVWEAAMAAAHQKVGNLVAIVDNNGYQQTSAVSDVTDPTTYGDKWAAFGWKVIEIDGHDLEQVRTALIEARDHDAGPVAIIAHTIKGKGLKVFEEDFTWHGRALPKDKLEQALEELG